MWKNCWADVGEVKRGRRVVARTSDKRAGDLVVVVMGMYIMLGDRQRGGGDYLLDLGVQ